MVMENTKRLPKRKIIVTGHYGSGKTEFSLSLAMNMTKHGKHHPLSNHPFADLSATDSIALVDLDIINPYFRSREHRKMLAEQDIIVYGSVFDTEITAELPALGANIRKPLEDKSCRVIIDVGGNDTGAMILNQFSGYFAQNDTTMLAVINASRPETSSVDGILEHIYSIESITGLTVSFLVNNTHLLRETDADTIKSGHLLCMEACSASGKQLLCDCYPTELVKAHKLESFSANPMPIGMYLRPTWLDR